MTADRWSRTCLTADEAFAELGIDRTTGYRAIKQGTFPVPVIRIGRLIRVPTVALRRVLDPDDATLRSDYDDDPTAAASDSVPSLRLVARPESAHSSIPAAIRPERSGVRT